MTVRRLRWVLWKLAGKFTTATPASRIYPILAENRVLTVENENRTYPILSESRILVVTHDDD